MLHTPSFSLLTFWKHLKVSISALDSHVSVSEYSSIVFYNASLITCLNCACSHYWVYWSVTTWGSLHRGDQNPQWKMPADSYRTFIELVLMPANYTSWILSLVFGLKMLENNGIIVLGAFGIWSFPHSLCVGIWEIREVFVQHSLAYHTRWTREWFQLD
jgi:hypothetical protein